MGWSCNTDGRIMKWAPNVDGETSWKGVNWTGK
jgi:hypothetical protein